METDINEQERELNNEEQQRIAIIDSMIEQNLTMETSEDTTVRFKSAEWYDAIRDTNILLAGIGGIGRKV